MTRLLPPNIAQELKCAVKKAASVAIRASQPSTNAPDARTRNILTAELGSCFEEAISELSSEFNTETTVLGRLSNELWCMVFSFLPMADLVHATHVCHKWRSVALAHPVLWSTVEYTSDLHYDDCDCHLFRAGIIDESEADCEGGGSSNLHMVKEALARSGSMLPISLHVDIAEDYCSHEDLERLAHVIEPYLSRLAWLHIRTDDDEAYAELLGHFHCLPALRMLSVRCPFQSTSSVASWFSRGTELLTTQVDFPVLETIKLDIPRHSSLYTPAALPVLTTLQLRFKDPSSIIPYLDASPHLRRLCLSPTSLPDDMHPTICETLRERMRSADDIQVMEITPATERGILDIFDSDAFTNILLSYKSFESANHAVDGVRILRHLGVVAELSLLRRCDSGCENLIVSARSPTGQTRELAFVWREDAISFNLSGLWRHLAAPPRSLVLDLLLWSVLEKIPSQTAASIKKLTIFFSASLKLPSLAQDRPDISRAFAALEEVEIAGYSWADALPISSSSLLSFLQWLCAPEGVQQLVIRHIKLDEHSAQLQSIARMVIIR